MKISTFSPIAAIVAAIAIHGCALHRCREDRGRHVHTGQKQQVVWFQA